jgi:hypothetical protein
MAARVIFKCPYFIDFYAKAAIFPRAWEVKK